MKMQEVLAEHGLEIDDIRWYLATQMATRLLGYKNRAADLTRLIWSGKLEAELYHAEERFLAELDRKLAASLADEQVVREIAREIEREKRRRTA
jgi:hypothetical protein